MNLLYFIKYLPLPMQELTLGFYLMAVQASYKIRKHFFDTGTNEEILPVCNEENAWAIVTGGTSGIGRGFVELLLQLNYNVIVGSHRMKGEIKDKRIIFKQVDLSSLVSVRDFAEFVKEKRLKLKVIINNAGVLNPIKTISEDGFDQTVATNYLGHALLTMLLLPMLNKLPDKVRIINISSTGYISADMPLKNTLYADEKYNPAMQYARSKLYQILFSYKLQEYITKHLSSNSIISIAAEPGAVNTSIIRNSNWLNTFLIKNFGSYLLRNPNDCASIITKAALKIDLPGCHFVSVTGSLLHTSSLTYNEEAQDCLWNETMEALKL